MLALFLSRVHTLISNGGLLLSWEQCQNRKCWSRNLVWARRCTKSVLAGQPEHPAVFNQLPPFWGWEQVCAYFLQEWSLGFIQPSNKPHWVSNQIRGLILSMLEHRSRMPNMWLEHLTYQGGSLYLWYPSHLLNHSLVVWVMIGLLLFPSYQIMCVSFFTALIVEEPFCWCSGNSQWEFLYMYL